MTIKTTPTTLSEITQLARGPTPILSVRKMGLSENDFGAFLLFRRNNRSENYPKNIDEFDEIVNRWRKGQLETVASDYHRARNNIEIRAIHESAAARARNKNIEDRRLQARQQKWAAECRAKYAERLEEKRARGELNAWGGVV